MPLPNTSDYWSRRLPALQPPLSNSELRRVRNVLSALNALHAARTSMPLDPRASAPWRLSHSQHAILWRVATRVRAYGEPPDGMDPELALAELVSSKDLYGQEPKNLAPFSFEKLRVLKGDAKPKPATSLLPDWAADPLRHFDTLIEMPVDEIDPELQLPRPYWCPVLANNPAQKALLLQHLVDLRIVGAHLQSKAEAALFFVWKKNDNNIRMVVDARRANA